MRKVFIFYFFVLVFSLLISLPLLIPYFHPGYFPTHDGEWAVVRLADMFREVKDLQFPPRFSANLNFGYGYPLFNFAYPLPYYMGVFIHSVGFNFVDTIKIIFAASIPLSAFFMFLASRSIWKNDYAGIISAVLYLYFPYRLVDLYVRGSIGESVTFVLFPIILFALSKLNEKPKAWGYVLLGGVSFGLLILAHNIMSVLFSISVLIFFLASLISGSKKIFWSYVFTGGLGFILSAFFWIPALLEKNNILLSVVPISDRNLYFVNIKQLLFSPWGYGVPTDIQNGFTYQVGWPFLLVLLLALLIIAYKAFQKIKIDEMDKFSLVILIGILVFSILMFSFTKPIWKLPMLSEINYPWTILSQIGLLTSMLAGYLVLGKISRYVAFGIALLALLLYLPLAKPSVYFDKGDGFYFTNQGTTTSSSELMPLWVKSHPVSSPVEKIEILKEKGKIENLMVKSNKIIFNANLENPATVRINTIYYPGWKITNNGKPVEINYQNQHGVMEVDLPQGANIVEAKFGETNLRLLADLMSLVGIGVVIVVAIYLIVPKIKKWKK